MYFFFHLNLNALLVARVYQPPISLAARVVGEMATIMGGHGPPDCNLTLGDNLRLSSYRGHTLKTNNCHQRYYPVTVV